MMAERDAVEPTRVQQDDGGARQGEGAGLRVLQAAVQQVGFDCWGDVSARDLVVRDEVRVMCASGKCHQYGRNWACPPACGDLDDFRTLLVGCSEGVVFQTVAHLEDEFDGETMMEAEELHKQRTCALVEALMSRGVTNAECVVLSAGVCTQCRPCAYPEPCRFPEKRLISMEAAGLLVTDACTAAGIPYNHGKLTIAYSSCALLRQGVA